MASEKKVHKFVQRAGYTPLPGKGIIVKFAPQNMSAHILNFFNAEYYALQMCQEELVLLPFAPYYGGLREKVNLRIAYREIQTVQITEEMLNYRITITTGTDTISLTAQQKELSDWRSAGLLSFFGMGRSWHKENMDATLEALGKIHS